MKHEVVGVRCLGEVGDPQLIEKLGVLEATFGDFSIYSVRAIRTPSQKTWSIELRGRWTRPIVAVGKGSSFSDALMAAVEDLQSKKLRD